MADNDKSKQKAQFNILSGDSTDGDSEFGVGTINLDSVTPVIVDPEGDDAHIDMGALHARSKVEKRVRFKAEKEEHADSRVYWIVWIVTDRNDNGPFYSGVGACEIRIRDEDRRIRQGYKSMPEHVNHLDKALKHHIIVEQMDDPSKRLLRGFLQNYNQDFWNHSPDELKTQLSTDDA